MVLPLIIGSSYPGRAFTWDGLTLTQIARTKDVCPDNQRMPISWAEAGRFDAFSVAYHDEKKIILGTNHGHLHTVDVASGATKITDRWDFQNTSLGHLFRSKSTAHLEDDEMDPGDFDLSLLTDEQQMFGDEIAQFLNAKLPRVSYQDPGLFHDHYICNGYRRINSLTKAGTGVVDGSYLGLFAVGARTIDCVSAGWMSEYAITGHQYIDGKLFLITEGQSLLMQARTPGHPSINDPLRNPAKVLMGIGGDMPSWIPAQPSPWSSSDFASAGRQIAISYSNGPKEVHLYEDCGHGSATRHEHNASHCTVHAHNSELYALLRPFGISSRGIEGYRLHQSTRLNGSPDFVVKKNAADSIFHVHSFNGKLHVLEHLGGETLLRPDIDSKEGVIVPGYAKFLIDTD